jgi:hypothetical protein
VAASLHLADAMARRGAGAHDSQRRVT